ncbi:predicted protein [Histoplasma capsulatum var. duboisii H88]|uniref:Predicted protein n=1 Tax=Ajellomyces capsulatus (strain H88) TaxID=544711 RepID=F0UAA4_AJEC8|nr:predicted protein [Histoplasma capsulatum var. duboisii H88]
MSNASSATPARHCIAKRAFGSRKLCRQSPATAEYIYVALALDAAVGLLSSRAAKDAMARITRLFDEYLPSHLQLFRDISDAGIARSIDSTPRQVIPPTWRGQGAEEDIGESGRTLETVVLGATLEFFDVPKARLNTVDRGPQQERKKSYKTDD